ncbi:uncharacterized protein BDCG_05528 [Blastomyces dermatitidis ER-3]|uniref:Uncharacterized protein n=2 Tax=Ajellomyces dermatitidis TaxID=5039 RepID=F2TC18_AJEDA|nr:uncharacterized protein BDCG_05528 [Blastomyces dermatitidis ER-3]EEQ90408.1 hypothetical protein BDCG_05528 [Blastomyces dermatitidis ER-3]EGE80781.1 hypothetical protein BDDG_03722 [Blastomyces dermatitidis ATCC 18188]
MRDISLYISFITGWVCLFNLSWASPVDLSLTKFPPCPSPPTWDVKDAAGFPAKCARISHPSQRVRLLKIQNRRRQKVQFLERTAPSQNGKKSPIPVGSNGEKRQIIDEPTHERDPFFPDPIATSFPKFTDPPQFTRTIWEDPFDEPSTSSPTTFVSTTITSATQTRTTFTPRTSIALSTPAPTQMPENSEIPEQSKSDAGPIIAGCSIGGIALISILYLSFNAWRRSRNKNRGAGTSTLPPPYASQPMGERGGAQTGFVAREAPQEIYPPAQAHTASWTHGPGAENPPDVLGQLQRQPRRTSRRYYAAFFPTDTNSNGSSQPALQSNSSNIQNRGTGAYTETSNPAEPFTDLPIVTEESPHGNLPLTAPVPPLESAAGAARQPTSYRSRRDSRNIVRRSLFGSISSTNSSNGPDQGTTDYDWQNVSYPTPTDFGRHYDVSPIEPTHSDRLPFGNQRSPSPTLDTPQPWASNIRPNSPVSLGSVENVDGQHSIATRPP